MVYFVMQWETVQKFLKAQWLKRKLLNTISNSNTIIPLSIWKLLGQSKYLFFKWDLNKSCSLCIMMLDEMVLENGPKIITASKSGSWKSCCLTLVFLEVELSHLLSTLGKILKCLFTWTNEKQMPNNVLGENTDIIWEENELFVNCYLWLESEVWLFRYFLHICFSGGLFFDSVISFYSPSLVITLFNPISKRKEFQKYIPRMDMKKKTV